MIGSRFGRYVVLSKGLPQGKNRRPRFLCQCDCGNQRLVTGENLRYNHSLSCGCIKEYLCAVVGQRSYPRHGCFETPEYKIWSNFKIEAKKHGFDVDPKWATDFKAFLDDMGERPTAWHRLRRRDTKGPFNIENCFWKKPLSTQEKEIIRRQWFIKWKAKNGEVKRLKDRLLYLANKDRFLVYARTRRALKNNAPGHHSKADIYRILKAQRGRCGYCRVKLTSYHVDHIQSLSRGGHNGRRNLQILCAKCNLSKGAKDPIDYARQIGKLI